jgi:hypothetical protein
MDPSIRIVVRYVTGVNCAPVSRTEQTSHLSSQIRSTIHIQSPMALYRTRHAIENIKSLNSLMHCSQIDIYTGSIEPFKLPNWRPAHSISIYIVLEQILQFLGIRSHPFGLLLYCRAVQ